VLPLLQLAFQKLDSNGDGFISLDEIILSLPVEGSTDSGEPLRLLGWAWRARQQRVEGLI
jgi:hypothetical protein